MRSDCEKTIAFVVLVTVQCFDVVLYICIVDTSDWDTALASIPSTVYEIHILSRKNGCLTVYKGHICVYVFILTVLLYSHFVALQQGRAPCNSPNKPLWTCLLRTIYLLNSLCPPDGHMKPQINFREFKFLLWQLSQSLLCSAWCCEYFGVPSIFWCPPPPTAQGPIPLGSNLAG